MHIIREIESLSTQLSQEQAERESITAHLLENQQKVKSLANQLNEITSSRLWKLSLMFQKVRAAIAPSGGPRDRFFHSILNVLLAAANPLRKAVKERIWNWFDRQDYLTRPGILETILMLPLQTRIHCYTICKREHLKGRDPGPDFSTRWYLENYGDVQRSGVNPLTHYVKHGAREGRIPLPPIGRARHSEVEDGATLSNALSVFTICSRNFTAYAKTLFESVNQYHPDAEMFLILCDDVDSEYLKESFPFKIVTLSELEIPGVEEMAQRYNITEFNTAIKPFAFSYLFRKLGKSQIIYLDPDIILLSPLQEVVDEFSRGAECVLTPHILQPAENVEMSDIRMLQFGIYNLGFLGLRKTPDVLQIVDWWERQLVEKCVINLPEGLFVDQKWADLFPAFIKRTSVLHHPGYNVAYWNLSQRTVEFINDRWYSNRIPLRFVHFSGNNLNDPYFLSRHSGIHTRDNIGDLNYLLQSYRERLFRNGHAEYSKIPYSFSWSGASGINLHTPRPYNPDDSVVAAKDRKAQDRNQG